MGAFAKVWYLWRILYIHTKWKNWIKAICDKVEMNTVNGGKLSNLNQVRDGTKLSALYPHSQCNTSDLKILKQEIEVKV